MHAFSVNDTGDDVDREKTPKSLFTHTQLPAYVDPNQIPVRRRPFSTIVSNSIVSGVSVALPQRVFESIEDGLSPVSTFTYARVTMRPSDLLETEFLTEHIKKGNVLMRSQGRCYEDNFFVLSGGILRIEVDNFTYEKCGLEGKPIEAKGKIHVKTRYAIEIDLRSPSMLHGKKGFKRVEWALSNVLNTPLKWRYVDLPNLRATALTGPILKHNPITVISRPSISRIHQCSVPYISSDIDLSVPDDADNLFEWTGLVLLSASQLRQSDKTDPFYSRYTTPSFYTTRADGLEKPVGEETAISLENGATPDELTIREPVGPSHMDVVILSWSGLIPSQFVTDLWMAMHCRPRAKLEKEAEQSAATTPGSQPDTTTATTAKSDWAILSASGFDTCAFTVLGVGKKDVLSWECWD